MILATVLLLFYIMYFKPFVDRIEVFLNTFNHFILIAVYAFLVSLLYIEGIEARSIVGYFLIALVLLLFTTNIFVILISKIV